MLDLKFDREYEEMAERTEENRIREKRRKKLEKVEKERPPYESDENFAYIAGYTSGGFPYGVTWEQWEQLEHDKSRSKTAVNDNFRMEEEDWESLLNNIDALAGDEFHI